MEKIEAPEAAITSERGASPAVIAAHLIHRVTGEKTRGGEASPRVLAGELERRAEFFPRQVQELLRQYIAGLLRLTGYGANVAELPQGVGGLYDGRVRIAEATVRPDEQAPDVATLLARLEETGKHEGYHAKHHHEQPLRVSPEAAQHGIAVTIGREQFRTQEEIVEALVVLDTGNRFVSKDYRQRRGKLLRAIDTSSTVTLEGVREAVNRKHDLTGIDETEEAAKAA